MRHGQPISFHTSITEKTTLSGWVISDENSQNLEVTLAGEREKLRRGILTSGQLRTRQT